MENVLDILRSGIDSALLGLGRASIHDLDAATTCVDRPTASPRRARRPRTADAGRERAARPASRGRMPERGAATRCSPSRSASTEQHGPHLPLSTDTDIAVALAGAARGRGCPPCVVAPPVAYGASGEHHGFAGTLSIGQRGAPSCCWSSSAARRPTTFARVAARLRATAATPARCPRRCGACAHEGRDVRAWSPRWRGRRARRPRRDLGACSRWTRRGCGRAAARRATRRRCRADARAACRRASAPVSPNGVLGDPAGRLAPRRGGGCSTRRPATGGSGAPLGRDGAAVA